MICIVSFLLRISYQLTQAKKFMSKDHVASVFYKCIRHIFYIHAVKSYFTFILGLEACKKLDLIRKVDIFDQLNVVSLVLKITASLTLLMKVLT